MVFIQWHIGDWISGTSLMSATERGVYFDLLMRYYGAERPLMQSECNRIARAYDEHEREAMQYVLKEHFTLEDGVYRHRRCDLEIASYKDKVEKRSKAAKSRWEKSRKENGSINADHTDANAHADEYASAHADVDANYVQKAWEPITSNHEPIKEERGDETAPASPAEPAETDEKPKKRSRRRPSIACPWSLDDEVPEDLAAWAKEKHPSVDFVKEFEKLIHWAQSHDERRPDWPATFRGWIARAEGYAKQRRAAYQSNRPSPLSEQDYSSYDELWGRTGIVEG